MFDRLEKANMTLKASKCQFAMPHVKYLGHYISEYGVEPVSEWVIKFNGLSRTADSEVHIVHISRVIIACTLKSLSPPTQITHNLQATNNF